MPIVIKKRVSFEFLGEDYKDSYLIFQSIPLIEFENISEKIKAAQEDSKAASFMLDTLKEHFIEGKFPDLEKVVKEDLDGLDPESVIQCFSVFTGQNPDPKAVSPKPSSTVEAPQN